MPTMTLLIEMHSQFKMIEVTHLDNQQCAEERISQLDKISFWLKLKVILQWKSIPSLSFIAAVSFPWQSIEVLVHIPRKLWVL